MQNDSFELNKNQEEEVIKLIETQLDPIAVELIKDTNEEIDKIINESTEKIDVLLSIFLKKIDNDFDGFIYHFSQEYNNARNKVLVIDNTISKNLGDETIMNFNKKFPYINEQELYSCIDLIKNTFKNLFTNAIIKRIPLFMSDKNI